MTWARCAMRVAAAHRLLVGAVLAAALGAALAPGDPIVTWLAGWTGGSLGHGASAVQALAAAGAPTGTAAGREVTVRWDAVALSGGTPVEAYVVRRYSLDGVEQVVDAGCAGPIAGLGCVEGDVPPGRWRYTVTPVLGPWVGAESPPGATVTVASAELALDAPATIATLPATVTGTVAGFGADAPITFHLDSPTGPALVGTPAAVGPDGATAVSVTIPAGTDDSPHEVVVIGSDGTVARAPITVVDSPTLTALEAFDVDGDGRLDRVTATFDEPLAPYAAGTTPWTLVGAPTGVSLASVSVAGPVATLALVEGAATTAVGGFAVALAGDAVGVRDANGHRSSFAATPVLDRAAPVPLAAPRMLDTVVDGKVDQVTVTMSETLAPNAAGTRPVTLADAPSGAAISAVSVATSTLTIALAEGAGPADTTVGSFTVAVAAAPGGVRDAAGNLSSFGPTTPSDAAAPFPIARLAFDDDADGRIDRVIASFSEPLEPYAAPTSVWTLGAVPSGGSVSSVSVAGDTATLALDEGPGPPTTAVTSTFQIGIAAHAAGVRDAAGNRADITGGPTTTIADRAAPQPLATTLLDVTDDGRVDRVTVAWTEPLATETAGVAPWTLSGIPSGGALAAVSTSVSTSTLTIAQGPGPADTAVGAMTVSLAPRPTGARDAAGNPAAFTAVVPLDGAPPVPVAVAGLDGATDGRIEAGDTLSITFSEPLATASVPTATTIGLADAPGGTNDTLDLPGITSGPRDTGSNLYLTANNRVVTFVGTVAMSPGGETITVTVGPTCAGSGCGAIGTATAAADLLLLGATTLTDRTGLAPTTTARTFSVRLF